VEDVFDVLRGGLLRKDRDDAVRVEDHHLA